MSAAALLVVDDNEDNRYTLGRRLERQGYSNIEYAAGGVVALELLRAQNFDLVLLDVMMPDMTGYDVLEVLRADPRLRQIPVIMISALDQLESVIRCIELGAEDYLAKPFSPTLLRARVGASLEKKRLRDEIAVHLARIEQELAAARDIQLSMVPTEFLPPPAPAQLDLHALLRPARQIGGDLYDHFYLGARTLCVAIADVAGKGVPSALFMARTKTLLRTVATLLAAERAEAPAADEIVVRVNRDLCRDNPSMTFVTLFLGLLDLPSGRFSYCNAGHNIPYRLDPAGDLIALAAARGKPLGIGEHFAYSSASLELAAGDLLFLYTDGVTEATNAEDELFDESRLEAELRRSAGSSAAEVIGAVTAAVRGFAGRVAQSDDIAVLALRRIV